MRKIATLVMLILLLSSSLLFSGDYQDISLYFGPVMDEFNEGGISSSFGINIGLNSFMELDMGVSSELVPHPFFENRAFLELDFCLFGPRSTASRVAGLSFNMLAGLGGFFEYDADSGEMKAGPYLSFTPLCFGNPMTGRRERFLKTDVGYDAINNGMYVSFSFLLLDFYVRGTYRDYAIV